MTQNGSVSRDGAGRLCNCGKSWDAADQDSGALSLIQVAVPEYVEVTVEVPRGSFVKRKPNGTVDIVGPIPCPFNYGSVPSIPAPDGDPLDAVVLGPTLPYGHTATWRVRGMVKFLDAGEVDNKLICIQQRPPWRRFRSRATNLLTPAFEHLTRAKVRQAQGQPGPVPGSPSSANRCQCGDFTQAGTQQQSEFALRQCSQAEGSELGQEAAQARMGRFGGTKGEPTDFPRVSGRAAPAQGGGACLKLRRHERRQAVDVLRDEREWTRGEGDLTLAEWALITAFFSGYAVFKTALNSARGKHGRTSFEGWEFP